MKILLAGATGNIGYFLYTKLKDLVSVDSIFFGNTIIGSDFTNVDFSDNDKVKNHFKNYGYFDALIFFVGLAHSKGKNKNMSIFNIINYQTLVNLLSVLSENEIVPGKIIFASSISVYGEKLNQSIYREDSTMKPKSPYAITKLKAEEFLIKNYSKQSWILRFAPVYSENFNLNINRRVKIGHWFYRVGEGSKRLSLCSLENIEYLIKGILEDKVPTGIYNVSDKKVYTYNDLLIYLKGKWFFPIPKIIIKVVYYFGRIINNIFLEENSIKLLSDNIFPSDKLRRYMDLPTSLDAD